MKGDPLETFKKFAKKVSQSRKNMHKKFLVEDDNLNSSSAEDSQGLVRTCQVLDQSLHVPLLALQVLDQSSPYQSWGILEIRCEGLKHGTTQNRFRSYKDRIGAGLSRNNSVITCLTSTSG